MKITNVESLEQYEYLLIEKSEMRKLALKKDILALQKSINPLHLILNQFRSIFPILNKAELKTYSIIELLNWGYKTVTKNKETPSIVRLVRLFLPKFFAAKSSF